MFISRKTYDELNARCVELAEMLRDVEKEKDAIKDDRYSVIAENILLKDKFNNVLKLAESNSCGRTAEQRLNKIKEVITSDQTK